ncbi:SDR family oxidoreductase [Halieaceae bacterium IMCC8485]|jgi:NAD(P)-dependent dehydrogenase (short-subunit alcohol dehydrogenase family)|uniref:SDR family oxidoreductase n=1 Tax=Candidatus Seongchinamella marina TaxID=2518990 RepID=A0ABT3SQ11_9GAMM|nr:SDR family oxidoreductase [Candidatus Seongchinamella marina]MCX2972070.1 SDR family oxidoreductase [Candidatus Seongchinamella marina]
MHSLDGKSALIIGATSGIGLAVAINFVNNGASAMITGRRESGEKIAEEIGASFMACDASVEADIVACLAQAEASLGKLNILIINAGCAFDEGSIEDLSSSEMDQTIDLNLKGAFYVLKHAPAHLSDGASVIYTGSVAGSGLTHAGTGAYAASKAGGAYLARTSAIENAPRNIRVNTVCPALIADTGMMVADDGGDEARFLGTLTAFGRMGRQDEVTGIYNFLASDASTFITGQEICVDGGMSAGFGLPLFAALAGE